MFDGKFEAARKVLLVWMCRALFKLKPHVLTHGNMPAENFCRKHYLPHVRVSGCQYFANMKNTERKKKLNYRAEEVLLG